jgi:hypothetical protein
MDAKLSNNGSRTGTAGHQLFPEKPIRQLILIVLLFAVAFTIRIYHINQPPLVFHPTRQYRSAFLAREYYFRSAESIPEWRKQVALLNKEREGIMEPPIREFIASLVYRVIGGEQFWVLRLMSISFWLVGGVFLYRIARDIAGLDAAFFSAAFYLFLPFGILASTSMQPDALMVMALLVSTYVILQYYNTPSAPGLLFAATISAIAVLVKPLCLFSIFGVFSSLAIFRQGLRRAVISPESWVFFAVSLLPSICYYSYGIFFATGLHHEIREQAQRSFFPHFLFHWFFWRGWLHNIDTVVGYPAFLGALFGYLTLRQGLPGALLTGLWGGYFLSGLVFTYHIHTHDYYSLQLIPAVALSIGPLVTLIVTCVASRAYGKLLGYMAVSIFFVVMLLNMRAALDRIAGQDYTSTVRVAREIGEITAHSTKTIFMSRFYGKPLQYYGDLFGMPWPRREDFEEDRLLGKSNLMSAEQRFNTFYTHDSPEYFIVTNFPGLEERFLEFERQPDLKEFLAKNFDIVAQNDEYLIYDLRKKVSQDRHKSNEGGHYW